MNLDTLLRLIYYTSLGRGSSVVEQWTENPRVAGSIPALGTKPTQNERKWLSGRASPCQGEGRGFESPLPLHLVGTNPQTCSQTDPFVHLFVHLPHIHRSTHTDIHGLSLSLITGSYPSGICLGSKHSTTELRPL